MKMEKFAFLSSFFQLYQKIKMVFALVLFLNASTTNTAERITTCDGSTTTLTCPLNNVINIKAALYGRTESLICRKGSGRNTYDANCLLESALQTVTDICNGKSDCNFVVGQPLFPDPCPGTWKYLTLTWECVSRAESCPAKVIRSSREIAYVTSRNADGGWFKDPLRQSDKVYYMARFKFRDGILHEFDSPRGIISSEDSFYHVKHRVDGTGFIVYGGNLFYNKERTRDLIKYNLARESIDALKTLPEANYHGTSPYSKNINSDINFAVDESGLWTIYATEKNEGNIVVSRMNMNTLEVVQSWHTSYEKLSALNAFIACEVLYVINGETLQIDYIYNMTSSRDAAVNIPIPGINSTTSAVKYNPKDKSLYIWDNSIASIYKVTFEAFFSSTPIFTLTPTVRTSTTTITSTPFTSSRTSTIYRSSTRSPIDPSKSSTSTVSSIDERLCSRRKACGISWPDTAVGETASISCPGNSKNIANWTCGEISRNPEWITTEPDLSGCGASKWLKRLEEEINDERTSKTVLSAKLAKTLNNVNIIMGVGDIILTIELLNRLSNEAKTESENASNITDEILRSTSALLQQSWKHLWNCINKQKKTEIANKLADVVQNAAFAVAKYHILISADPSRSLDNYIFKTQPHVTFAIKIKPVPSNLANHMTTPDSTEIRFRSGTGDVISINTASLMKSLHVQQSETLAVVYLSYQNLASYIEDDGGVGSSDYPVNSRLTTVSARRMLTSNKWSESSEITSLAVPLTLRFQHNHNYYSKHICAYWKSDKSLMVGGSWWRAGCELVQNNASLSTCQCTHLTSFALLSSNKIFPFMGADEPKGADQDTSDLFSFINVVRVACIFSLLILVFVLIFLCCWRKGSDLTVIHRNIIVCALISQFLVVIGIDQSTVPTLCAVVAGLLHYTVLCSFTWAAIESLHHVMDLTNQLRFKTRWKVYCVAAYVIPLFVVGISAAVDYSAYLNQPACWLCTTGDSMWFIIAPCCVSLFFCVACVATLTYKLNKRHTTTTDASVVKKIRLDGIKNCILVTLLCLKWSFAFVWLSGVPSLAVVFAIICFFYGLVAFVLHCCFTPKNRLSKTWPPFKQSSNDLPRTSRSQSIIGGDGSSRSFDYRYSVPRGDTATTLVPFTIRGPSVYSTPTGDDQAPLMSHISHDSVIKIHTGDSIMRVPVSSVNGDKNFRESMSSHQEQLEVPNTSCAKGRNNEYPPPGFCSQPHKYEQPSPPEKFCSCTTSTSYSCCYDHLHMDSSQNKALNSEPNRCQCSTQTQHLNPQYFYQGSLCHQYETLTQFSEEPGEKTCYPPCHYRNVADEAVKSNLKQIQPNHVMCRFRNGIINQSKSRCTPASTWQNSSYGFYPNSHKDGRKNCRIEFCGNYNGRCSDPLSTDQGYDTDSQQPGQRLHYRSDGQGTSDSSPSFPEQETTQPLLHRNSSLSGKSDNDREVELINSASASAPVLSSKTFSCIIQNTKPACNDFDETSSVIETSIGGTISASDTVSSWSAVPGSNPRAIFPSYGVKNLDKKKITNPQEILEQARLNCAIQRNADLPQSSRTEKTGDNGYTLPGTTEAGTKARIDLLSGGVNMITNL